MVSVDLGFLESILGTWHMVQSRVPVVCPGASSYPRTWARLRLAGAADYEHLVLRRQVLGDL